MKRKNYLTYLLWFILYSAFAQNAPPQALSYSAIARDNFGNPVVSQSIGIEFSILKGSTIGPIQYTETHFTTTNQFGLMSLKIGTGNVMQGSFNAINWGNDSYYLKVSIDITGGSNFQLMGINQFLSVPYALYAGNSFNLNDHDTSAINELQSLLLNGDTIKLSGSNQIILPKDTDRSPTNEIQYLSLNGDTLQLSQGNNVLLPINPIKVKLNNAYITDPGIDDVTINGSTFITERGYVYNLTPLGHTDSVRMTGSIVYTGVNCNSPYYVVAEGHSDANIIEEYSKGRIFACEVPGFPKIWYIPINSTGTTIADLYQLGDCINVGSNYVMYRCYPNDPQITGFNFTNPRVKLTFER